MDFFQLGEEGAEGRSHCFLNYPKAGSSEVGVSLFSLCISPLDIRKNFFTGGAVRHWNRERVKSLSLEVFKTCSLSVPTRRL